jgi:alpha/beta superfamily hydrolase
MQGTHPVSGSGNSQLLLCAQMPSSNTILVEGPVGPIETIVDDPGSPHGLALIAHPHPLFGGTNNNKVAYTLAHCLRDLGYLALRPNFRGVGRTAGAHDHGDGETDDLLAVLAYGARRSHDLALPVVLAGYSFGAFVQTRVARRLAENGQPATRLVLVGLAAGRAEEGWPYQPEPVPRGSLLIHGERDTTIPLANVLAYAEPLELPVTVIPGADHFFHGRLKLIREIVQVHCTGA